MGRINYQEFSKNELISRIKQLEKKKYGLIWEDKSEDVADECRISLPILTEVADLEIKTSLNPAEPMNILIEGDNYHALYVLCFTHKRSIDFIYIDPPYNTGKAKEWKYNDRFIDSNDPYKHSKWLSFMDKRLSLAKQLLKPQGIMFISIDDHELPRLLLLCDKIFGEQQVIACLPTIMNLKGNQAQFGFAGTHEYTLVVAKSKQDAMLYEYHETDENLTEWLEDEIGAYKKGAPLQATGTEATRETRPQMFYPILVSNDVDLVTTISDSEYKKIYDANMKLFDDTYLDRLKAKYEELNYTFVLPMAGNRFGRWRWGWSQDNKRKLQTDVLVNRTSNGVTLSKKQRPKLGDIVTKKPKSFFYKPSYSSGNGTALLKSMFGSKVFENPKPLELIKDFIRIGCDKDAIVLDFFAGSGTTAQAVLELNHYEKRRMQFIMVTNNENNICEEVCYPRIKKVIDGCNNSDPIPANVKYYRTGFVPQVVTDQHKRDLVLKSTEMLCMVENTFTLVIDEYPQYRIYKMVNKATLIIYDEEYISESTAKLTELQLTNKVVIYVFSYDHEYNEEDFQGVHNEFVVKPIPEVIMNVYRKIAKRKKH
ncbi:MAG: site-specific DNA-methyltransferase [Candidatus Cloacimonetes bacterium]|nr:site-specific DNA-methyltransferase [Candidatus Cloacimonadota bacterium]